MEAGYIEEVCLEKSGNVELLVFFRLVIGLSSFGYIEEERLELLTCLLSDDCVLEWYGPEVFLSDFALEVSRSLKFSFCRAIPLVNCVVRGKLLTGLLLLELAFAFVFELVVFCKPAYFFLADTGGFGIIVRSTFDTIDSSGI